MRLKKIIEEVDGKILNEEIFQDIDISGAYSSDLLSDVMGNSHKGEIWITIMRHMNVIAVASLSEMPAILFSKNFTPDKKVIEKAISENIILIASPFKTFELCGKIYNLFNKI